MDKFNKGPNGELIKAPWIGYPAYTSAGLIGRVDRMIMNGKKVERKEDEPRQEEPCPPD